MSRDRLSGKPNIIMEHCAIATTFVGLKQGNKFELQRSGLFHSAVCSKNRMGSHFLEQNLNMDLGIRVGYETGRSYGA
jgi:hypothetical protein